MKKKIGLLLSVLVLVFSFAGCGSSKETVEYDKETLVAYADSIIGSFSQMDDAAFAQFTDGSDLEVNLTMLNAGLPVEKDAMVSMINAWKASIDECGAYVEHGDFTVDAGKNDVTLSTEATYEERDALIEFKFDEKLNMESMDVSAHYTTAEILEKAGLNTLLGMGTVFAVLIFLAFIISLMKYIPAMLGMTKKSESAVKEAEKPAVQPEAVVEEETDDYELVAVITAAVAAQEGTSTDGFVVRSIRRRTSNNWN